MDRWSIYIEKHLVVHFNNNWGDARTSTYVRRFTPLRRILSPFVESSERKNILQPLPSLHPLLDDQIHRTTVSRISSSIEIQLIHPPASQYANGLWDFSAMIRWATSATPRRRRAPRPFFSCPDLKTQGKGGEQLRCKLSPPFATNLLWG